MKKIGKPAVMSGAAMIAAVAPAIAFAQGIGSPPVTQTSNLAQFAALAIYYFNVAIVLIIGLAIIVFIWNIYQYFVANKDSENKGVRGMYLLWSVIGLAVILSFWGLVNLLSNTFNLNTAAPTNFYNLYGGSGSASTGGSVGSFNTSSGGSVGSFNSSPESTESP